VANRTSFAHVNLRKAFMIVSKSEQESWDFAGNLKFALKF
jgi:hypothetical protein